MKKRDSPTELRKKAEDRLKEKSDGSEIRSQDTVEKMQHLVHELQVHQIELELQNEELEDARAELEVALSRYSDLYDFAPMGYPSPKHASTGSRSSCATSGFPGWTASLSHAPSGQTRRSRMSIS